MMKTRAFKYCLIPFVILFFETARGQEPKPTADHIEVSKMLKKVSEQLKLEAAKRRELQKRHHTIALRRLNDPPTSGLVPAQVPQPPRPPKPLVPATVQPGKAFIEKSKTISKSYKVDRNDKLQITNQFGNVNVIPWSKKEIKVQIEIKAFDNSDSRAEALLKTVSVVDSKTGDLISFKTNISRENSSGWMGIRRRDGEEERRGVQIDYIVYMPSTNDLNIANRHGSIVLPDFSGEINIDCSYGSLRTQKLLNPGNRIKVSYGSANIESLSSARLDVSYGSLKLGSAEKLEADINYSSAQIGKLSGDSHVNLKYAGTFQISRVESKVKNLNINAAYSTLALGFDPAASFDFDVTVSYAGFNYEDGKILILSKSPEDDARGFQATKNYKGRIGKGSDSRIIVNSRYGSVRFN